MADDSNTSTPEPAATAEPAPTEATTEEPQKPAEVPPEMKAALRKANKEAETLRLKLKEFEDRDKSDLDKLNDRATTAEQRASESEAAALRLEVAFEKELTPAQAKRLVGSTREELEADAEEIKRDFPTKPGRPTGDIAQGPRNPTKPLNPVAADLAQIEDDLRLSRHT